MPKNKEIGGCAGTQYGCCPDGVTAKKDADGSNCPTKTNYINMVVSGYKLTGNIKKDNKAIRHNKHINLGVLSFNIEKNHNNRIFSLEFRANKAAEEIGMYSKIFSYKVLFENTKQGKEVMNLFDILTTPENNFAYLDTQIVYPLMFGMMNFLYNMFSINAYYLYLPNPESEQSSPPLANWQLGCIAIAAIGAIAAAAYATNAYFKEIITPIKQKVVRFENTAAADEAELRQALVDADVITPEEAETISTDRAARKAEKAAKRKQALIDKDPALWEQKEQLYKELNVIYEEVSRGEITQQEYDLAIEEIKLKLNKIKR